MRDAGEGFIGWGARIVGSEGGGLPVAVERISLR